MSHSPRPRLAGAFTLAASLMLATAGMPITAQAETTLRLIASWNAPNPFVPAIEQVFTKGLADASKGEIRVQRSGAEVVPVFEQFQPLAAGVFDLAYTHMSYHQATTGVGMVLEAMKPEPEKRREVGITQWVDEFYHKRFGVRVISIIPGSGYYFLLREPLAADNTLKGRKMRSNPLMDGIIRELGGIPVTMGVQDIYSTAQKGVIDGGGMPTYIAADYKYYEVLKYIAGPPFGDSNTVILANAKKFDALSPALQKIILEEGRKMERYGMGVSDRLQAQDTETLMKQGMKVSNFDAPSRAKMQRAFTDGIYANAMKSTGDDVKAFWEFARARNMINE